MTVIRFDESRVKPAWRKSRDATVYILPVISVPLPQPQRPPPKRPRSPSGTGIAKGRRL